MEQQDAERRDGENRNQEEQSNGANTLFSKERISQVLTKYTHRTNEEIQEMYAKNIASNAWCEQECTLEDFQSCFFANGDGTYHPCDDLLKKIANWMTEHQKHQTDGEAEA